MLSGAACLFVQAGGKRVRELAYDFATDQYDAPDLSVTSSHLFSATVKQWTFCREPNSIVWVLLTNGKLIGLTYNRLEKVVGWHQHTIDGTILSICSIPWGDHDELWALVQRTISGAPCIRSNT